MKLSWRLALALLALAVAPLPASAAEQICNTEMTAAECLERVTDVVSGRTASDPQAGSAETLANINTGQPGAVTTLPTSTTQDFFSLLKVAADSGEQSDQDRGESLGFEFSKCLPSSARLWGFECQIRARLGGADAYEPLVQQLNGAGQSALVQELRDGLSHEDNVVGGVFANLVRGGFGRRLDFSEGGYFDLLRSFVTRSVSSTDELDFEYLDLVSDIRKANPALGIGDEDFVFGKIPNTEDARRAVRLYERAAIADVERKIETRRRLIAAGYRGLVLLANNQPQLHFGMEYAARDDAVGPDELRAKITYERGAVNTNSLRDFVAGRSGIENCSLAADERDRVARCISEYLQDPQIAQSLQHGDRIAVTLEYVRRERYQASFGAPAVSFNQDAFDSFIASAMYGRYLSMNENGMSSRIDFVAAYEDVSNDPNRQDRGVAAATYSRDISPGVSLQIGLVYATKPEFRAEAEHDLTARLGLNFKVDGLPGGFAL